MGVSLPGAGLFHVEHPIGCSRCVSGPADITDVTLHRATHPVMAALAARVPLTLLLDLADPAGPDSRHVLATEVADLSWLGELAYPSRSPVARAERPAV